MVADLRISDVTSTRATPADRRRGLLCFVSFTVNQRLRIDGVAVRRSATGDLLLAFPRRKDRAGRNHDLIRPVDQAARDRITRAVLEQIDPTLLATTGVDQ